VAAFRGRGTRSLRFGYINAFEPVTTVARAGIEPIRLPRRSPNLNAFVERFNRSIKEECLDRVIPLGEAHLRELVREYVAHYHEERPHQGLSGRLIAAATGLGGRGPLARQRLGGLLNYYDHEAA
jgi:hypothetical protein